MTMLTCDEERGGTTAQRFVHASTSYKPGVGHVYNGRSRPPRGSSPPFESPKAAWSWSLEPLPNYRLSYNAAAFGVRSVPRAAAAVERRFLKTTTPARANSPATPPPAKTSAAYPLDEAGVTWLCLRADRSSAASAGLRLYTPSIF
jgi:hypothetical protein